MNEPMLSRVAETLYWMSRYLERAEYTARLVDVALDLMPDRSTDSSSRAWKNLYASLRLKPPKQQPISPYNVTAQLTFDTDNPSSIVSCIALARENARQVREQISSEMWEQLNRLYLDVTETQLDDIWSAQPHLFFRMVKEGAHLFQGIGDTTMNHGEGWRFIQVGKYIERAGNVAALLNVHLQDAADTHNNGATTTDHYLDLVGLLRYCTAFEAYCKVYTAETRFEEIAEFLLLNDQFPYSVHHSIKTLQNALNTIADLTGTRKNTQVYRQVGRLKAMLDYDQIGEVIAGDLSAYLEHVQKQCAQIHESIYQTYINYPASEKLAV